MTAARRNLNDLLEDLAEAVDAAAELVALGKDRWEAERPLRCVHRSDITGPAIVVQRFVLCEAKTTSLHSCSVFQLGHVEDVVEGRPVLLTAEPAVFHVQPLEHRRVELLAGAVAGLAVGVAAASWWPTT